VKNLLAITSKKEGRTIEDFVKNSLAITSKIEGGTVED